MNKKIIYCVAFLVAHFSFANTVNNNVISIPKHYKTENTFSGNLSNNNSFHLIFTKNKKTKNYEVFSYLFNGEKTVELPSLITKQSYNIVSFHQKNEVLSLLLSYNIKKKSFIKKVDFNLKTKTKTDFKETSHEDLLTSIRGKDKSILIYKTDEAFRVLTYPGNLEPILKELTFIDNSEVKKFFKNTSVTSVKTDEFVANGATSKVRLYYENNTLFFTRDSDEPFNVSVIGISLNNKRANITEVLKFDLSGLNLSPEFLTFENGGGEKFKKATSFFTKEKLFQLALSKKVGFISISDVHSGKLLNTISLDNSISNYVKGNVDFQGIENFLNNAGRNKYNATITANKTKSDKVRIRVDYVDITYSYNYNWWWHHQMFMMQQQQFQMQNIHRNIPSGFGPNALDDYVFENAVVDKEKRFFELLIDAKGNLLKDELPSTLYKEIVKENYINKLEDISDFKFESSCFLENSFRFIAYSKSLKQFSIQSNKLK